ncbi:hypothetical protein [Segetibacter sp.]|jgi:hypothetical protein|uniref:hypothetical protein n=1 Tax=Segetibacter sp. TaxID=2231182 RepID=UPI002616983A|nr:hypothetical protein [Segetibacter sp.]MCW3078769.1 hypothetical protein [Segetibacter sp.]
MKKLLVILFALGLTLGAVAQPKIGGGFRGRVYNGGGAKYVRPRVTVIAPYAPMYRSYGMGLGYGYGSRFGYGYSPFNDPFYYQRNDFRRETRPTQLDLQIEDIENEYDYKISSAKEDKSISKDERKQKVRDLKYERDQEVIEAKKNFYKAEDEKNDTE